MYGEIAQHIITGKSDEYICERINYYIQIFGKERYYLEIQEHPDRPMQANINETIIRLSKRMDMRLLLQIIVSISHRMMHEYKI